MRFGLGYCFSRWHIGAQPVWTVVAYGYSACYTITPESDTSVKKKNPKKTPCFCSLLLPDILDRMCRDVMQRQTFSGQMWTQRFDLKNQFLKSVTKASVSSSYLRF